MSALVEISAAIWLVPKLSFGTREKDNYVRSNR